MAAVTFIDWHPESLMFEASNSSAEKSSAKIDAQFHRHVKAGHASCINLDPRKVAYTPIALANHGSDLADTDLRAVGRIERATRMVARRDDREDHREQN
jgi:hypothetical protein